MQPGSVQFRQHIQNKFPRGAFEPVSEWLKRINSQLGLQPRSRLAKLYYDQGTDNARFTTTEYQSIFGHSTKSSENRLDKRLQENLELREELKEIKALLKQESMNRNAKLKLILEAFAS